MRTSISDNRRYPTFCEMAAKNDRVFLTFKRNLAYTAILEHVSYSQGKEYLEIILSQSPELTDWFNKFRENDRYGDPYIFDYGPHGEFSPTTLRYIKVLSDLRTIFGDLNNMRVIEIGGGYGGQCKIISDVFDISSYIIVDLKPVLNLAKKYLDKLKVKNVKFLTADALTKNEKYDLVISNYAFTECTKTVQDIYFEKVIMNSQRGYITCNFISDNFGLDSYAKIDLINKIENCRIIEEKPLTHPRNCILVWDSS